MNDVAAKHGGKTASQVPISKHPAFPAIVALWFAALLGIGSLVLPASLFEAAIGASGIASVLPAAEPPLGVTARILIALVAALLGVISGLLIARKIAAAQGQPIRAPRRAPPAASEALSAKRPISAHEELWSEGFDEPVEVTPPAPIAGRRRALSVTDESGPSEFLDSAPLPGGEAEIVLTEAPPAAEPIDVSLVAADDGDGALELAAFAESDLAGDELPRTEAAAPEFVADTHDAGDSEFIAEAITGPAAELPVARDGARPFDAPLGTSAPSAAAESPAEQLRREFAAEPDQAFAAAPAPFAAPASPIESFESADSHHDVADHEEATAPEPQPLSAIAEAQQSALGELSISELVERFAQSLQHAAERAEAEAAAQLEPASETERLPRYVPDLGVEAVEAPRFAPLAEPAAPEPPAEEPAPEALAGPETPVPAALRPVAFGEEETDEEDGEEFALTRSLTPEARPFDRPPAPAAAPAAQTASDPRAESAEPDEAQESLAEHGYSSLLNMRKQVSSREVVRIDDEAPAVDIATGEAIEPVVVFPGQEQRRAAPPIDRASDPWSTASAPEAPSAERPFAAPASMTARTTDSMHTERALREALHKLQRLSGAA